MSKIEEIYDVELINRVFVHELGHYLANKINYKNEQPFFTNAIFFMPCGEVDLCGKAERNTIYIGNSKERLAQDIGRLIMGCIFQSYFSQTSLGDCFTSNGNNDYIAISNQRSSILSGTEGCKIRNIVDLENKFLEILKNEKDLDFLYDLNPLDFINELNEDDKWYVNLEKLDDTLERLSYKSFELKYLYFLKELDKVIFS